MKNNESINPVERELITNRFRSLVLEMGEYLRRTSLSTNIRERLDFSCGLLDADCQLIVNAPHIPVHLGAMGMFAERVTESLSIGDGDVVISNHPAIGGSHLPDITLLAPVDYEGVRIGYLANRAHHAELGGRNPGSLVPDATRLDEEGVIIKPFKLVEYGTENWDDMESILRSAKYPTRSVEENIADLRAQLASIRKGTEILLNLARSKTPQHLSRMMESILDHADTRMRSAWMKYSESETVRFQAEEKLDQDQKIKVSVQIEHDKATFDFADTSGIHSGNLNATEAIVQSAILYTLRVLTDHERPPLPLNSGLLRSVKINLPGQTFLNPDVDPDDYPAVMGGNVEVSQRLVDTLFKAFRIGACSQGTMNNFVFGNDRFGMYETICGGTGATNDGLGADAVHSNMTNTRITDPEVLERRFPVVLHQFAIRKGSGGDGRNRGGDGVIREFEFREAVSISIMAEHRTVSPYGFDGGSDGAPGEQFVMRENSWSHIPGQVTLELESGNRIRIETPGGGGFGKSTDS